jgi:hypothetical protein
MATDQSFLTVEIILARPATSSSRSAATLHAEDVATLVCRTRRRFAARIVDAEALRALTLTGARVTDARRGAHAFHAADVATLAVGAGRGLATNTVDTEALHAHVGAAARVADAGR